MQHKHQGMRLWIEPNQRLASGMIEPGSDVNLTIGVEPADASNQVQVLYRVNDGLETVIPAEAIRHVGNTQYFRSQLPCAALCEGDTVEYSAVCKCAGRQVPSQSAERAMSSFRVMSAAVSPGQAVTQLSSQRCEYNPALEALLSTKQPTSGTAPKKSIPTHLSLFVLDRRTGHPISRVPFYAEVGVRSILKPPPIPLDYRPLQVISYALQPTDPECQENQQCSARVAEVLVESLSRLLSVEARDQLAADIKSEIEFLSRVIRRARDARAGASLYGLDASQLESLLNDAIRAEAEDRGLRTEAPPELTPIVWAHPMGVLATDHVGYLSFDLTRLPPDVAEAIFLAIETLRRDPNSPTETSIWVYPMAREETRIDALAQMRIAHDAIVVKIELDVEMDLMLGQPQLCESLKYLGFIAMQNPNLTDWRLSPASFANNPSALVGEEGCENLFPAQIALQEFLMRQVVRLTDVPQGMTIPADYKMAYIDEYKVSWHSLGHSLGEILYSLPLAPGESVKLAVIDWSWDSLTKRDEQTKLTEEVLHQTHRDRTITETVKAGLQEFQHGSSFMGGGALSVGGSASIGVAGLAAGATGSLGGATSTSEGSRELTGENVQRLSDSFSQASSAQREINSTVVIQARQEENESIQTRTFTNYNHSHTLTILYYEVLRHFKVTVEWVRRRTAVLVKYPQPLPFPYSGQRMFPPRPTSTGVESVGKDVNLRKNFWSWVDALARYRFLLESSLLDMSLKVAFEHIEKLVTIREHQLLHGITPSDNWIPQPWQGNIDFSLFEFGIKTAGGIKQTDEKVTIQAIVRKDNNVIERPLLIVWDKFSKRDNVNVGDRFDYTDPMYWFVAKPSTSDGTIKWHQLIGFEFILHNSDEWGIERLAVNAFHSGGSIELIENREAIYYFPIDSSSNTVTSIQLPGPKPDALPPSAVSPEKSLSTGEYRQVQKLIDHFMHYSTHYNRLIWLNTDPNEIMMQFETKPWQGGLMLADVAEPYPLEVSGSYVAYPLAQMPGQPAVNAEKSERLITLPTRGVFAEGKLGHCNISEEIDNTRFWKWEEHPIPFEAPGINPVTPITPQPQQTNIAPTPFPQSLVNIVNPSPAPDPSGLTAALSAITTPNIFRDMSGRAEVADLLKKLSDNTIAIAEASNRAREIQSKYGGGSTSSTGGGVASDGGTTGSGQSSPSPATSVQNQSAPPPQQTPEQRERQNLENQQKKAEIAEEYLPLEQKKEVKKAIAKELKKPAVTAAPSGLAFLITFQRVGVGSPADGEAKIVVIPVGKLKYGSDYNEGETIGPPTQEQRTTVSETYENKIIDGTIRFPTDHASAPGNVRITAKYLGAPGEFVKVIGNNTFYDEKTHIFTLEGARSYLQPKSGNVIVLEVIPVATPKKIIAKSVESAVEEGILEVGGSIELVTVKSTGKQGKTKSGENGDEYNVWLMTGGLDIQQKNKD